MTDSHANLEIPWSNRAGMAISGAHFALRARLVLRMVFALSPALREMLWFGRSPLCLTLQKLLVWLLGGVYLVDTRFTDGPMAGDTFRCWTSEKYFMLGSRVEAGAQQVLQKAIQPGLVVYDIGGHAGYMSLLFARLTGLHGRVFAFEPSPLNYVRLRHNLAANKSVNVTVIAAAVSEREGFASLHEAGTISKLVAGGEAEVGTRVRTIRLDDFVYREGQPTPDFLKIDIEGHAGAALDGMPRILSERHPAILCELHDPAEQMRVVETLIGCGYAIETLDDANVFPRHVIARPVSAGPAREPSTE